MDKPSYREFAPVSRAKIANLLFWGSSTLLIILLVWSTVAVLWPTRIQYTVTTETLTVTVGSGSSAEVTTLQLGRITEASPVVLRGGNLRFGSQRPGLCHGFFNYPALGGEVWIANTCGDNGVLIRASSMVAPLIVSPVQRDAFIEAIHNGRPGSFAPIRNSAGSLVAVLLRVFFLVVVGGVLATVFLIAPGRLCYRVKDRALEIRTLRGWVTVPLEKTRVRAHTPLVGERITGLPLPGYLVGSHQFDNQPTAVFASHKGDGVLIEGEGRTFVTPSDRDGMLAALVEAGATLVTGPPQRRF